jgi:prophage regulatory protein
MSTHDSKIVSEHALQIVREPERLRMTGVSRVQFWRLERDGKAPARVPLGPNSVGWLKHELEEWIVGRAALRRGASRSWVGRPAVDSKGAILG